LSSLLGVFAAPHWRSRLAAARVPLLLLYGFAWFVFAVSHFDTALPNDVRLMSTRSVGIEDSLEVVRRGGPPLLGCTNVYEDGAADMDQRCFATGTTDDQGIYLYLPLIGKLTNETEPPLLLKWVFAWLMALTVLVAPLLFVTLFRSMLIGLLAPLPLIYSFDFLQNTDIYWISAWAILVCLPLVLVIYDRDRWDRGSILVLLTAVALGGFASSIRSHAGLPILIAAALTVLLRDRRWRARALAVTALALTYLATSSFVLAAAREYRDHSTGVNFTANTPTKHPFWHSMYLGLGYLPNPYGIKWNDAIASEAVSRENPTAVYLSDEYERTLRGLYLDIVRDDPGFVASTYKAKLGELLRQVRTEYGLMLLLIPAMALFGGDRRRNQMLLLLISPALAITLLPPLLTRPDSAYGYNVGWLAAVGFTCFVAGAWLIRVAQGAGSALMRADPQTLNWESMRRRVRELPAPRAAALRTKRTLGVVAAAVAVTAFLAATRSPDASTQVDYAASASALVPEADLKGSEVSTWSFRSEVPSGWAPISGVEVTPGSDGTNVATTVGSGEYQIMGDPVTLEPGTYRLDVAGVVREGGIQLGALDQRSNTWINQSLYWWGQTFQAGTMVLPLTLDAATTLQFVLANWNANRSSQWTISRVRLVRE
jgi:hypothetical protein